MNRRGWLRAAGAGALWLALCGHSPYRQWDVYRKTRLVLLTTAADPQSVQLGSALAKLYLQRLPESRATLARARDGKDLVRLLASRQLDIAVMRGPDAHAALAGEAPYADAALMGTIDLVVQIWTMGTIAKEPLQGLLAAVKNGAGMAGWHGGMGDAYRQETDYRYLVGGDWVAILGRALELIFVRAEARCLDIDLRFTIAGAERASMAVHLRGLPRGDRTVIRADRRQRLRIGSYSYEITIPRRRPESPPCDARTGGPLRQCPLDLVTHPVQSVDCDFTEPGAEECTYGERWEHCADPPP